MIYLFSLIITAFSSNSRGNAADVPRGAALWLIGGLVDERQKARRAVRGDIRAVPRYMQRLVAVGHLIRRPCRRGDALRRP